MTDSVIDKALTWTASNVAEWPAEFARSLVYGAIQAPLEGITQIRNQLCDDKVEAWQIVKAPQEAPFLSLNYHMHQLGGAVGMMLPLGITGKGLGLLGRGLGVAGRFAPSALTAQGIGCSNAVFNSSTEMLGLANTIKLGKVTTGFGKGAATGFVYDFTFSPSAESPEFWSSRFKHGLSGALTFGTMSGLNVGLKYAEAYKPFQTEMRRHLWSGLTGGIVSAESRSLLEDHKPAPLYKLVDSIYNFTVIGSVLGGYQSYKTSKSKNNSASSIETTEIETTVAKTTTKNVNTETTTSKDLSPTSAPSKSRRLNRAEKLALAEQEAQEKAAKLAEKREKREIRRQRAQAKKQEAAATQAEPQKKPEEARQKAKEKQLADAQAKAESRAAQQRELELLKQDAERERQRRAAERRLSEQQQHQRLHEDAKRKFEEWKSSQPAAQDVWNTYKEQLERPIERPASARGDKAQNELFNWTLKEHQLHGREHTEIAQVLKLRQDVQQQMKSENWDLVETNKNSLADSAGMDYILANKCDGRYFLIDATLNARGKESLPSLRRDNVIKIELDTAENLRQPTLQTKCDFLLLLKQRMSQESALNLADTPPPNSSSKLSLAESIAQLQEFRQRLANKCDYLDLETRIKTQDGLAVEAGLLQQTKGKLQQYNNDLNRVERYVRMKQQELSDPDWAPENSAFEAQVHKTLSTVLIECFQKEQIRGYAHEWTAGEIHHGDSSGRRFVYSQDQDSIFFYESVNKARYQISGVNKLIFEAVSKTTASKSGSEGFDMKRRLLTEGSPENRFMITKLLERLGTTHSHVLLNRSAR